MIEEDEEKSCGKMTNCNEQLSPLSGTKNPSEV
jgi:hypothetical protein